MYGIVATLVCLSSVTVHRLLNQSVQAVGVIGATNRGNDYEYYFLSQKYYEYIYYLNNNKEGKKSSKKTVLENLERAVISN